MTNILAIVGAVLVVVGILMGKDNRRDLFFALGGVGLMSYTVSIDQPLYTFFLGLFVLISIVHLSKHKKRK